MTVEDVKGQVLVDPLADAEGRHDVQGQADHHAEGAQVDDGAAEPVVLPAQFVLGRDADSVAKIVPPCRIPQFLARPPVDPLVPTAHATWQTTSPRKGLIMRIANRSGRRAAVGAAAIGVVAALAAGGTALATGGHAGASGASTQAMGLRSAAGHPAYGFRTLDDHADLTFNQLLGINDDGLIAGYFGSGAQGHPNMGYLLGPGGYQAENFPGSVQTQVTGLNNQGVTVGFWSGMNTSSMTNDNFGFYAMDGQFHSVNYPTSNNASPPVNQLLGVNDSDVAVGFYTGNKGNNHGYTYDIRDHRFSQVLDPADPAGSLTAAAINDRGDVAGFYTGPGGKTDGFLKTACRPVHHAGLPGRVGHQRVRRERQRRGGRRVHRRLGQLGHHARLHLDPAGRVRHAWMTRRAPAPPPSTASTTTVTWWASTPTARATPTGSRPPRPSRPSRTCACRPCRKARRRSSGTPRASSPCR